MNPNKIGAGTALLIVVGVLTIRECYRIETGHPHRFRAVGEPPAAQVDFIEKLSGWCAHYEAQKNEIKKSAVYRDAITIFKGLKIKELRGKIRAISTDHGGDRLHLEVSVDTTRGRAIFGTSSLLGIGRNTKIYNQAAEMVVDQCVLFDAEKVEPASVLEKSMICDLDFLVRFTNLQPCDQAKEQPPKEEIKPAKTRPEKRKAAPAAQPIEATLKTERSKYLAQVKKRDRECVRPLVIEVLSGRADVIDEALSVFGPRGLNKKIDRLEARMRAAKNAANPVSNRCREAVMDSDENMRPLAFFIFYDVALFLAGADSDTLEISNSLLKPPG